MKKLAVLLAVFMTFSVATAFAQGSPTGPCPDGDFPPAFYQMVKRVLFGAGGSSSKKATPSNKQENTKKTDAKKDNKKATDTKKEKGSQTPTNKGNNGKSEKKSQKK